MKTHRRMRDVFSMACRVFDRAPHRAGVLYLFYVDLYLELIAFFPAVPHHTHHGGVTVSRFWRVKFLCIPGVFDSAGPRRTRVVARRVLSSGWADTVDFLIGLIAELTTSGYLACLCPNAGLSRRYPDFSR